MPVQSELDPFETDLAELAAGVFGRREEATVLDHLSACPNCAAEFVKLASTAGGLLSLVPEVDPPVRFEGRFWDRIGFRSSDTDVVETVAPRA